MTSVFDNADFFGNETAGAVATEDTTTYYVQVIRKGEPLRAEDWRPWINVKPTDNIAALAAYRFARNAGFLNPHSESEGELFDVCWFKKGDPTHPNGQPKVVNVYRAKIVKQK